ncbi:hypothetical protein BDZ97DRAFT_1755279 [Flammula alnicola]|nr:hypothetical protein BDZ97DRAFT_1755279 [Flammula alnicola]
MAAVALAVQPDDHVLEPSENWDDDFEFQPENNNHTGGSSKRRPVRKEPGIQVPDFRKLSTASTTLEDWDAEEGPSVVGATQPTSGHPPPETPTENWDDDFEDARNSPKKRISTPRRHREESWDDDLDDDQDDSAEFGLFAEKEEDRTVTARSRRAALSRLSSTPPPLPQQPPSLPLPFLMNQPPPTASYLAQDQPFPQRSPTSSVFSVPNTVNTYSSTAHLRPTSAFALLPPSPLIHKERERRRLRKKSRPRPQGMFELASMNGDLPDEQHRFSFSDGETSEPHHPPSPGHGHPTSSGRAVAARMSRRRATTPMSDVSSVDEELEADGLQEVAVSVGNAAPAPAQSAPLSVPATPTKGATLLNRIGSVKRWGVMRKRGTSTTPSEMIDSQDNETQRTPRPHSSMSSIAAHDSAKRTNAPTTASPSSPGSPPTSSSHWFFRASSAGSPHAGAGRSKSSTGNGSTTNTTTTARRRLSRSRSRTGGYRAAYPDVGVGVGRSSFNGSRTSLSMQADEIIQAAMQRQREGMYTPSPSPGQAQAQGRPVSTAVGGLGTTTTTPGTTPSKLVKRKSLGFVQLRRGFGGHGGAGDNEVVGNGNGHGHGHGSAEEEHGGSGRQAKYAGLGLGRALGGGRGEGETEDEERGKGKEEQERKRRKSFSRLLRDRDKENESGGPSVQQQQQQQQSVQTPVGTPAKEKEGARGFMGSVRRISLVGRHKRTKSGSGIGLPEVPPSPSSAFFRASHSAASPTHEPVPPLPYSLPPLPASNSQLSLRLPSSSSTNHLPLPSRRLVSVSSSQSSSILPASSTSGSSSRNPSAHLPQSALARRPSSRSRASEEGGRRPSIGAAGSRRQSVDFESRIRRSMDKENVETVKEAKGSLRAPAARSPPVPLLPPIELQPPSPPQTIGQAASASASVPGAAEKSPPADTPNKTPRSLGAALNNFDTLSPTTSSSSLFFTPTSSPQPPASPNKLAVSQSPGKSPASQHSASLGRATAAGATLGGGGADGGGNGSAGGGGSGHGGVPRRNSLGDLKIPARISQAQVGIRRDLGMVREFATNVEQLKDLQQTYNALVSELQSILEAHVQQHTLQAPAPLPRTTSPSFFANLTTKAKPKTRARSNTNPTPEPSASVQDVTTPQLAYKEMASAFYSINSKYRISWECAELLIELGGGGSANATSAPPASSSMPVVQHAQANIVGDSSKKKSRERAVTLAGDQSKPMTYPTASTSLVGSASLPTSPPHVLSPGTSGPPPASPPNMSWRASTGRHDLSHRQLVLLREMLNNANATSAADESHLSIPEESLPSLQSLHVVNRDWRWGDARNSTITLPSEDSGGLHGQERRTSMDKKRKSGRLGMSGIRDMLRALKRSHTEAEMVSPTSPPQPAPMARVLHSTTSLSTQSSAGSKSRHRYPHPRLPSQTRRRAKTSAGPESLRISKEHDRDLTSTSPYNHASFSAPKPSPRRPSLASIFKLGSKHRPVSAYVDDPAIGTPSSSAANDSGAVDDDQPAHSGTGEESSSTGEEDWDRMDSASDLDAAAKALAMGLDGSATVRGGGRRGGKKSRSPYLQHDSYEPPPPLPLPVPSAPGSTSGYSMRHSVVPKRSFNASQTSLRGGEQPIQGSPLGPSHTQSRPIRLSNVEETTDEPHSPGVPLAMLSKPEARLSKTGPSPSRPSSSRSSKAPKTGSVRSMPPQLATSVTASSLPDPKLAMAPENIKPLLENAKEPSRIPQSMPSAHSLHFCNKSLVDIVQVVFQLLVIERRNVNTDRSWPSTYTVKNQASRDASPSPRRKRSSCSCGRTMHASPWKKTKWLVATNQPSKDIRAPNDARYITRNT